MMSIKFNYGSACSKHGIAVCSSLYSVVYYKDDGTTVFQQPCRRPEHCFRNHREGHDEIIMTMTNVFHQSLPEAVLVALIGSLTILDVAHVAAACPNFRRLFQGVKVGMTLGRRPAATTRFATI